MRFDRRKDVNPKYLLLTFTIICVICIILSYFASDSVITIKYYTNRIIAPIQKSINDIGVWTESKIENFRKIEALNKENEELKKEIAELKSTVTRYQNDLQLFTSLKSLYELDEVYPELHKTAAHVFAKDSTSWFSVFYIDKGTEDGLYEGANVMCDDGLAGIIIECDKNYSKVRAVIDDNSNISGKVMPANALCTVEGNIKAYQDGYLILKNIDKNAKISKGDKVVTSHISERFHAGITIGYVTDISYDSNNLTITAKITPAVNFTNVSEVLVITDEVKKIDKDKSKNENKDK